MGSDREQLPSRDEARTVVAADVFDDLVDGLDRAAQPNEALARASERARRHVTR